MESSPISDSALERAAGQVAALLRPVRNRAPIEVRRRVQAILEAVYKAVQSDDASVAGRVRLARDLESLQDELRGRESFFTDFYSHGRLAIVRAWETVRIRGSLDWARVDQHFDRYESRLIRMERRLNWFFERAGLEVEEPKSSHPLDQPYAEFDEYHEFLWGRARRRYEYSDGS